MSERRVCANQGNARLSTGPKSLQGKQASAENALTHGLSRARQGTPGVGLQDCEAAFLEVEEHAHQALGRLGLLLIVQPDDLETLDSRRRLEEISDAIAALEKLERYRTPRFRAWVKSLAPT